MDVRVQQLRALSMTAEIIAHLWVPIARIDETLFGMPEQSLLGR